jgi:subtilase family serine protease
VPALAPKQSSKGTVSVTLPAVAPGTYFLIAQADTNGDVSESHEGDNLKVKKVMVGPDLHAALAIDPAAPTTSTPTTITVTTSNIGFASAPASVTRLYRSPDYTIGAGDTLLRQWSIPALSAKQSNVNSLAVSLPPGTYFLLAAVDATNAVAEANEAQNVKRTKLTVP